VPMADGLSSIRVPCFCDVVTAPSVLMGDVAQLQRIDAATVRVAAISKAVGCVR